MENQSAFALDNQEDGIGQEDIDAIQTQLDIANNDVIDLQTQLDEALQALLNVVVPIYINLLEGWNIIGYTLNEEQDIAQIFDEISSEVIILKDNNGAAYLPEFGFNGIGNLIPGYGYLAQLASNIMNYTYPVLGN